MEIGWQTKEEDGQVVRGGKYFFLADDGFQVVFRSAHGRVVRAVFLALAIAVVGTTVALVLEEGGEGALVWLRTVVTAASRAARGIRTKIFRVRVTASSPSLRCNCKFQICNWKFF